MSDLAIKQGCITVLRVEHDDWCKTLKTGNGHDCNCNPEMKMVPLESDEDIKRYFEEQ